MNLKFSPLTYADSLEWQEMGLPGGRSAELGVLIGGGDTEHDFIC